MACACTGVEAEVVDEEGVVGAEDEAGAGRWAWTALASIASKATTRAQFAGPRAKRVMWFMG